MGRRGLWAPALIGALLLPSAAWPATTLEGRGPLAGGSLSLTEHLSLRYQRAGEALPGFEDHPFLLDYAEEVDRLNLLVSKGGFALGAQVDQVALLANRYYLDDVEHIEHQLCSDGMHCASPHAYLGLEKLYLRQQGEHLEVTVGDAYVSFGRGIALNLVRNTDIDLDTSLRGARALVHAGGWDFTAASGLTNPQQVQQDNPNGDLHPDIQHMVSGLRAERFGLGPFNLGAHGVIYSFERPRDAEQPGFSRYGQEVDVLVGGATVEAMGLAGIDLNAEFDAFDYRTPDLFEGEGGGSEPGYAAYASLASYPGRAVLLLEGKHYVNAERVNMLCAADHYELAVAPTLEYERVITEDSSATVNSNDVSGLRLRVDYPVKPGVLMPYVSLAAFRDRELGGLHFNQAAETILHPVAGVQWLGARAHVIGNLGGRADLRDEGGGTDVNLHADVDIEFPAGKLGAIELSSAAMRFMWGENPVQQADFLDMTNALALHATAAWTFILYQDYSDNPLISSEGNLSEHVYGAAEVQYKPSSSLTTSLFYGSYKAGIRCAGGQCRSLPGFSGLKFGLSGTF
ncbi:MAG: hypothetical protein ABIO70_30240 [Pseudomonadota bacterium]